MSSKSLAKTEEEDGPVVSTREGGPGVEPQAAPAAGSQVANTSVVTADDIDLDVGWHAPQYNIETALAVRDAGPWAGNAPATGHPAVNDTTGKVINDPAPYPLGSTSDGADPDKGWHPAQGLSPASPTAWPGNVAAGYTAATAATAVKILDVSPRTASKAATPQVGIYGINLKKCLDGTTPVATVEVTTAAGDWTTPAPIACTILSHSDSRIVARIPVGAPTDAAAKIRLKVAQTGGAGNLSIVATETINITA